MTGDLWGQLACLGAATCYGFTFGYTRKFLSGRPIAGHDLRVPQHRHRRGDHAAAHPGDRLDPVALDWPSLLSLLTLGALGTGVAYIWNINVLRAWGPTNASTVTYVTPVVGVVLGVLVLGETFSWHEPARRPPVLLGILLTQKRLRLPSRHAAREAVRTG